MMLTSHTKCAWPSMEGTDPPSDEVVRPPIHETSNSHPVSFKSRGATPAWISSMSNPLAAATMRTAASGLTAASSAQVAQSPAPVHRGEARRAVVEDEEIVKPTPTTRATTMREDRPGIPRCARAHRTEKPLAATKRTRAAMRGSYPKRSGNQRRTRMYPRKASQIAPAGRSSATESRRRRPSIELWPTCWRRRPPPFSLTVGTSASCPPSGWM